MNTIHSGCGGLVVWHYGSNLCRKCRATSIPHWDLELGQGEMKPRRFMAGTFKTAARKRQILILAKQGKTHAEIAQLMGLSRQRIQQILKRGR